MNNKFNFFVPANILKSKDKNGNEVMKIAGIASTIDKDSDNEVLDPSGFDLSYFMKNGFINWDHRSKDNPDAIIGEPTKCEVRNGDSLYVEGLLYPDSELARNVYKLAQTLDKNNGSRKLGFSIEGQVIERDDINSSHVKKAKITGLAITPSPKNSATIVDIIKGEFIEFEPDYTIVSQKLQANGGNTNIIDITKPDGERIVVDRNYFIKIISKSDINQLSKEDLEKKIKNIEKTDSNSKKDVIFKQNIKKSQIFNEMLSATDGNFEISKSLTDKIDNIIMKNNKNKIDLSEIKKALESVGLDIDDDTILEAQKQSKKNSEDDEKSVDEIKKSLRLIKAEMDDMKKKMKNQKLDDEDDEDFDDEDYSEFEQYDKKAKKTKAGVIEKSLSNELREIKTIMKSFSERIQKIETTPNTRKSIGTGNYIEKSFNSGNQNNQRTLSVSSQKQQILDILLDKSGIEKGESVNPFYSNALVALECSNTISKAVVQDIQTSLGITIIS